MYTSQDRTRPVYTWRDKGVPSNGTRHPRANGARPVGAFTRGNRGSWGEDANGVVPRPTVGLAERQAVVALAHPYADLPDAGDGTVTLSGRFRVRAVEPAPEPNRDPDLCLGCFITPCECGKW